MSRVLVRALFTLCLEKSKTMGRGAFVVFEGCDKCGKSTQSSLLVKHLQSQNVPVEYIAFPNRKSKVSGQLINAYLTNKQDMNDQSIHLLFTVNRWELQKQMRDLLASGTTLVVDRYSYSGIAYSTAKGLDFDWCMSPEKGLLRPDLVFYLDVDSNILSQRETFGDERYEEMEFQKRVASVFARIYEDEKYYWKDIDATKSPEKIHDQVSAEVRNVINVVKDKKINILWE